MYNFLLTQAHIHTANKCQFYFSGFVKNKEAVEDAIDKALAGDWKPLQEMLKYLW